MTSPRKIVGDLETEVWNRVLHQPLIAPLLEQGSADPDDHASFLRDFGEWLEDVILDVLPKPVRES